MKIDTTLTDAQLAEALAETGHEDIAKQLADKVQAGGGQRTTDGARTAPDRPAPGDMSAIIRQAAGHAA